MVTGGPQPVPPASRRRAGGRIAEGQLGALLTRRGVLRRASAAGLGALVASALPIVRSVRAQAALPPLPLPLPPGSAVVPEVGDATLQAFADTILPGCPASRTDLGNPIYPLAIAGVDPLPGAVQADALALFHHPEVGFDALAPAFLAELETRSLEHGADFLHLGFTARVQTCLGGLDFSNPTRLIWEAAAAVPFTAFCAAALIRNATTAQACGYRVMGLPGIAPDGYSDFSYQGRMSTERTRTGSLP
jgi:enediyne biosynthesis protein E8